MKYQQLIFWRYQEPCGRRGGNGEHYRICDRLFYGKCCRSCGCGADIGPQKTIDRRYGTHRVKNNDLQTQEQIKGRGIMGYIIAFAVGCFTGCIVGIVVAALAFAGSREDRDREVITDIKGSLYKDMEELLRSEGYIIKKVDLSNLSELSAFWDPENGIRQKQGENP